MTARYSYDIDEQSIGAYLKDIVDQVNDEQSTSILSSKHYDPQSYVSVLKQLVEVVNDNYSGDDILVGDYDHTLVAEVIRRIGAKVGNAPLPDAPAGFAYLVNADGSFVINAIGAFILGKV